MSNRIPHREAGARRGVGKAWSRILLLTSAIFALAVIAPRPSYSQEAKDDKAGDKAAPAAAPAAGDAAKETAKPKQDQQSKISWIVDSSGWIGLFILGLSIYFVATVSRLFLEMRPIIAMPPEIIARCEALLDQRDFKSIFGVVKEDNSFFSTALATGIGELPNGLAEAREAMEKVGESVTTEMEKKISMLAVLGTLGPMIGLLGTLMGMISSFGAIARGGDSLDPTLVAKGISQALVITFEGVFLSVPAIYFYALFRNRVSTISVTTMVRADQFLRHFAHAARGKGAGPGTTAQAAAAKAARP
jgi:biopolymer transport protein ExbB